MDTNDFIGSFAQENVAFTTQIVKTSVVGDNYWKAMIFVESDRFVTATDSAWVLIPGSDTIKALSVNANDYAEYTTGILRSWLYDLFCNGFTGECILVACAAHSTESTPSADAFIEAMDTAYAIMKPYAYHKTVCAAPTLALDASFALDTAVCVELATLCEGDKNLLSSAPYFPFTTSSPENPASDNVYAALTTAGKDAFMTAHQDTTRNGALYALGLAMSVINGSSTCVGNSMDMVKSSMITCSGPEGLNLSKSVRNSLKLLNIQTIKPVGDNTGAVAALGAKTLKGDVVQATWIIAYVTYMVKVNVARLITTMNYLKNEANYTKILNVMISYLALFGPKGSGRLRQLNTTAPSFDNLPAADGDVIIIPDAWNAVYTDQTREVQISGALYIGV